MGANGSAIRFRSSTFLLVRNDSLFAPYGSVDMMNISFPFRAIVSRALDGLHGLNGALPPRFSLLVSFLAFLVEAPNMSPPTLSPYSDAYPPGPAASRPPSPGPRPIVCATTSATSSSFRFRSAGNRRASSDVRNCGRGRGSGRSGTPRVSVVGCPGAARRGTAAARGHPAPSPAR